MHSNRGNQSHEPGSRRVRRRLTAVLASVGVTALASGVMLMAVAVPAQADDPPKPAPIVETTSEPSLDCEAGVVTTSTTTTTTDWEFGYNKWVQLPPVTTTDTTTRAATVDECPGLEKPEPIVETEVVPSIDCDTGVVTTVTTTTTTDWEFVYNKWVQLPPVTTTETTTRPATAEECAPTPVPSESVDVCPNIKGDQTTVPAGYTVTDDTCEQLVDTTESPSPTPTEVPEAVPTAVDAGLPGGPTPASSSYDLMSGLLGGGGLFLLAAAGWSRFGRRTRGVHQV